MFEQIIGQTEVIGYFKEFMEGGPAQVRVHDQYAVARLGEHRGEVDGGGGLAFTGTGADHDNGVELVILA